MPTAVADLHPGETVLDLGSGGGADVLVSARRVAPGGTAIGVDLTDEMLQLARRHAAEAGVTNVQFVKGCIEDIPLPEGSVGVVISNCVINRAADKRAVLREAARVLRPGDRFAVSNIIADPDMDQVTRADMRQWTGCISGRSPATSSPTPSRPPDSPTSTSPDPPRPPPCRRRHHPRPQAARARTSHWREDVEAQLGAPPATRGAPP